MQFATTGHCGCARRGWRDVPSVHQSARPASHASSVSPVERQLEGQAAPTLHTPLESSKGGLQPVHAQVMGSWLLQFATTGHCGCARRGRGDGALCIRVPDQPLTPALHRPSEDSWKGKRLPPGTLRWRVHRAGCSPRMRRLWGFGSCSLPRPRTAGAPGGVGETCLQCDADTTTPAAGGVSIAGMAAARARRWAGQ